MKTITTAELGDIICDCMKSDPFRKDLRDAVRPRCGSERTINVLPMGASFVPGSVVQVEMDGIGFDNQQPFHAIVSIEMDPAAMLSFDAHGVPPEIDVAVTRFIETGAVDQPIYHDRYEGKYLVQSISYGGITLAEARAGERKVATDAMRFLPVRISEWLDRDRGGTKASSSSLAPVTVTHAWYELSRIDARRLWDRQIMEACPNTVVIALERMGIQHDGLLTGGRIALRYPNGSISSRTC